ncbi:hypothetical protein BDR06DRAFT_1012422 [Suillus hirtellus]|nr:hypothetical protein BDR06DRAFT_1012422 [Suillus hirtellus]
MVLSRAQAPTYRSRCSPTPPIALPHWNCIEDDLLVALVLDMDDTSSCVESDLDPSSHHDSGGENKSQPDSTLMPLHPLSEINSLKPTPSVFPGTDDHMLLANQLAIDQFSGCDIEANVPPAMPAHQDVLPLPSTTQCMPGTGSSLPWVTTMIDFLSQFNQLKDDHQLLQETIKHHNDSFNKLTSTVQKLCHHLLIHQFGPSSRHNRADSQMHPPSGTDENALHIQDGPVSTPSAQDRNTDIEQSNNKYGQNTILETGPVVKERSGSTSLDHISQSGFVIESSVRSHPLILLKIKGPTVANTNISPTRRRSKRVESAKDAAYVSRKALVIP